MPISDGSSDGFSSDRERPVTHLPVTRLGTRLGIGEGKLRASQALDDSRRQPRALCRFQRWRRMLCEVAAEQDLRAIGAAQEEGVGRAARRGGGWRYG